MLLSEMMLPVLTAKKRRENPTRRALRELLHQLRISVLGLADSMKLFVTDTSRWDQAHALPQAGLPAKPLTFRS